MRLRTDSYHGARKRTRRWAIALLVLGSIGLVFAAWWLVFGVLVIIFDRTDAADAYGIGIFCGLFGGIFPLIASVLMLWRGVAALRRLARLESLAGLSRLRPSFSARDIASTLELDAKETERLVLEAERLGLLEAEAEAAVAPGHAADPLLGLSLNGTYRIERRLGAGGMGAVYAATHLRTGRPYAVKTLLPDARLSADAIRRFEREASAASSIGHPGIVAVHDFDETPEGLHYLVMDLLEGETLEQRLERAGVLAWPAARAVAAAVGTALAAAHARGLLHRDLKPANVFIARTPEGGERVVLLDFGLAKPIDAQASRITSTGAAVGTPLYMSPEQARGDAQDVRSDVFGLAAVLYEMVSGVPPFFDRTAAEVYRRLLTEPAPRASSVAAQPLPPGLDAALERALARDPAARFPDVPAFLAALGALPA